MRKASRSRRSKRGLRAVIVMPKTTPSIKVDAVVALGGEAVLHGMTYDDANAHARELEAAQGLCFVHPFNDPDVIAGQGTIGVEIERQWPTRARRGLRARRRRRV